MLWLSQTRPASVALAAVRLDTWLDGAPALCVAEHTGLALHALAEGRACDGSARVYPPLACVWNLPFQARILAVDVVRQPVVGAPPREKLLVLTDHPTPRLVTLVRADAASAPQPQNPWPFVRTESSLVLHESARPPAELGLGLCVEPGTDVLPSRWAAVHAYTGQLLLAPLDAGSDAAGKWEKAPSLVNTAAAFSVKLPHATLLSHVVLPRAGAGEPCTLALLSLSSRPSKIQGFGAQCLPVLSFHTPDGASQQLEPLPWGAERTAALHKDTPERDAQDSAPERAPKDRRRRPAAVGRRLDAEALNRREQAWLRDPVVHAHVPLPEDDAVGAHLACAVSTAAGGGVLVFCEESVLYVPPPSATHAPNSAAAQGAGAAEGAGTTASMKRRRCSPPAAAAHAPILKIRVKHAMQVCAAAVADSLARDGAVGAVLFGTSDGALYSVELCGPRTGAVPQPTRLRIARIGRTAVAAGPQAISYLGEGFAYVGSAVGDAVLSRVDMRAASPTLEEVFRWECIAPLVDFCDHWVEDGRGDEDMDHVITCSGAGPTCSVRRLWNGVSTQELASLDAPGCVQLWSVSREPDAGGAALFLVAAYETHTSVWECSASSALCDVSASLATDGVPLDTRALHAASLHVSAADTDARCSFLFVVARGAYVVTLYAGRAAHVVPWVPPEGDEIVACDARPDGAVLVGLQGGTLLRFAAGAHGICEKRRRALGSELTSIAFAHGGGGGSGSRGSGSVGDGDGRDSGDDGGGGTVAAVGVWDPPAVALVSPTSLDTLQHIPCAALPCSLLVQSSEECGPQLLVGMSSGDVCVHTLDPNKHGSTAQKTVRVGETPVELVPFATHMRGQPQRSAALALSSSSVVLHQDAGQLRASALRYYDLYGACVVSGARGRDEALPLLAAVARGRIIFLAVHSLVDCDTDTVPLGGHQATAIAWHRPARAVALSTWPTDEAAQVAHQGDVRMLDNDTLQLRATYPLLGNERPNSLVAMPLDSGAVIVVGTGFLVPGQHEATSGRLLGLLPADADDSALAVTETFALDVPGNVYAVAHVGPYLAAAVNAQVNLYRVVPSRADARALLELCSQWGCAFIASCLVACGSDGRTLVVGDAMRSLTVLHVSDKGTLHELARDMDPYWTTAVDMYDEEKQVYLGSDIAMNLFLAARVPVAGAAREWSHVMRRRGAFHYGDMMNRFLPAASARVTSSHWRKRTAFCTAAGAMGLLTDVDDAWSELLDCVQQAMAREVRTPGDIPWDEWRTLRTEHRVAPPSNVLDGAFLLAFLRLPPAGRERIVAVANNIARKKYGGVGVVTEEEIESMLESLPGC
ncbi:hypothetical protein MSPP1_001978 [Malassezia sp. CBS 17886]|nr:hypothetical protein MSPP1_001978 [Malassezia sp. CBS 17886]